MLDTTHGRAQMDRLRQELAECFTAPVFDRTRFAVINQHLESLLRHGVTGTPVEPRYGKPPSLNPTPAALTQRAYRIRLAKQRRANVIKRFQNTGNPANPDQG